MESELTDEQIDQLCMFMRVIDFLRKNQAVFETNAEMKETYELTCSTVNKLMDLLTEEQRNEVLEIYKMQNDELAAEG